MNVIGKEELKGVYKESVECVQQTVEEYLDRIERIKALDKSAANELTFQMAYFLFQQGYYQESIETWKMLQKNRYKEEYISDIVEEAFIFPNEEEFEKIYMRNIKKYNKQIHGKDVYAYQDFQYRLIPVGEHAYYVYDKNNRQIGDKIIVNRDINYTDEMIFKGDNACDPVIFWEQWDVMTPIVIKIRNSEQTVCFLSVERQYLLYLQMPEFEELFDNEWYAFDTISGMQEFFHNNTQVSVPKVYIGNQTSLNTFQEWREQEHEDRCSQKGTKKRNVLLTIGIPSYNRGHRALQNIQYLRQLPYDTEIEFLVCDNCSYMNTEGYKEIEKLAEVDVRVKYYRFPDNPGGNLSAAETIKRASGKFCCLLSDEDMICKENVWKYLYLIKKYGDMISFMQGSGTKYIPAGDSTLYEKGEEAFERVFWRLNYISGLCFKTDTYKKLDLYDWKKRNVDTNYFIRAYGHNAAAMRLALEDAVYICKELLFIEGEEDISMSMDSVNGKKMLRYATMEKRLEQLDGIIELLNNWRELLSDISVNACYLMACRKVFALLNMHREVRGGVERSFEEVYKRVFRVCVERIAELETNVSDGEYIYMVQRLYKDYEIAMEKYYESRNDG